MTNVYYRVWPGCLLAYTCTCVCISSAAPWKNFSQSFFLRISAQRQLPPGLGYSHDYTRTSTLYAFEHEPLFDSRYRETILWMNAFFFLNCLRLLVNFFIIREALFNLPKIHDIEGSWRACRIKRKKNYENFRPVLQRNTFIVQLVI